MNKKARIEKVVSQLPSTLEKNTIYYVRVGNGFEIYVTNDSGFIVAYPSNYWNRSELPDYRDYGLGKINLQSLTDVNTYATRYTGFYSINESVHAPFQYGTVIKMLRDGSEGGEIAVSTYGGQFAFREYVGGTYSQWYYTWHSGNFNPNDKIDKGNTNFQVVIDNGSRKSLNEFVTSSGLNNLRLNWVGGNLVATVNNSEFTLWNNDNFNPNTKVSKSGDTMTGGLTIDSEDSINSNDLGILPQNTKLFLANNDSRYGTVFWVEGTGKGYIQQQRSDGNPTSYDLLLQPLGGILYYGDSEVAKVDWVNTNFIRKTHPVNNITQANIDSWVTYGYLDNVLTDYAHKADANIFTKVNTFELSPIVPTGSNGSHAVNVAQLFEVASTQAVETINSKFITEIMNTTFAAFDTAGMGYPTILTVIAKSDGELRVEELKDGRSLKVRNVSSGNVEVIVNGGNSTIVSANEWAEYQSDGTGDITVTSPAGCYII
ncbi:hypothetical protein ACFQO9_11370 [Chryseobacterium zhengzhouense]|uniref:Uncharacterized protein n=1 Tax=Chryseobacterium zhengzhouense TaxID=1636086 RepID=A0ABW2LXI6_9FLAO